jgi:hypothetical protein
MSRQKGLKFAEESQTVFLTFSAHTTRIFPPFDMSVSGPVKQSWRSSVTQHIKIAGVKPTRKYFMNSLTPVFIESANEKKYSEWFS